MRQHETKETLREWLTASKLPSFILGQDAEAPREFFSFEVESAGDAIARIGVLSDGIGVRPASALKNGILFVGFNNRVGVATTKPLRFVREIELLSVFWSFIDRDVSEALIVLCETAVVAVTTEGEMLWRVDTDLISDFTVDGHSLSLRFSDDAPLNVDLSTGVTSRTEAR
jgi:hypothetical protein